MAKPSSIKTINQKIRRLARKYGTNSLEYERYKSDIDRNFQVHYTKDGILQINQPKQMSKYQNQIVKKLQGRKGIKELEADAKKRLIAEAKQRGQDKYKPKKADIEKEVVKFSERQSKIDDTLSAIYDMSDSELPTDIADIYNKFFDRGKGNGQGVTNSEIDRLIELTDKWEWLEPEVTDIIEEIRDRAGKDLDPNIRLLMFNIQSGKMTVDEIEEAYRGTLTDYLYSLEE